MATRSRRLELLITGDASKAQRALRDLDAAAGRHGKGIEKASSGIRDAMVGIGLASAGMWALGEWDEAQKVGKRTEAVIRSTGGAAGETAEEIEALSEELSRKTATDDEMVQSAATAIASLQKLRNEAGEGRDIFDRTTKAALDWAAATGGDAADAAEKLGKLLVNPEQALSRLTRAGVVFTDEEKKKLTALQATGDEIGQQVILLDAIERKVGGSAEAMATDMDRAKVAAGNAAEAFGGVLAPAIELVADVAEPLSGAFQSLDQDQQTLVAGLGLGVIAWQKWGGTAVETLLDVTGSSRDAETAVSGVNRTLAKAGAAAAAGITAYNLTYKALEALFDQHADAEQLQTDLLGISSGASDLGDVARTLGSKDLDSLVASLDRASGGAKSFGEGLGYLSTTWDGALGGGKMRDALNDMEDFDDALTALVEQGKFEEAKAAFDALKDASLAQGKTLEDIVPLFDDYYSAVEAAGAQNGYTETAVGALTDVLAEQEEGAGGAAIEFRSLSEAIDGARSASEEFYRQQFEQENAIVGAEASLDRFTESLAQYGAVTDEGTEAGRANRQAIQDYIIAAASASAGTDDAAGSMAAYTLRLYEAAASAGLTKGDVDSLLTSMGLTEGERKAWFTSNAYEEASRVQGLWDKLTGVSGTYPITLAMTVQGLKDFAAGGFFAAGGRPPVGKVSVVGEKGPELFVPDSAGTIVPNHQISSGGSAMPMSGGTTIVVNVQGSVISERDLVDAVAEGLARRSRSQGSLGFNVPASSLVGVPGL